MQYLKNLKERDSSLDLIRIVAFLSVISVHFFLNCEFYNQIVAGKRMYLMTLIRSFFMDCVPLFLTLSGFLMNKKRISSSYYIGILKIVVIYILSSVSCLLFVSLDSPMLLSEALLKIAKFSAAPYSWYIEMYLGLFLLIPFLNLAYNGLENKRQKQILLVTMLFMTALPSVININEKIIPAWWTSIFPITYYYIGAYLSEYFPKIKTRYLLLILAPYALLIGRYNYIKSCNRLFIWGMWNSWGSILNVITTVLVFCIVKNINTQNWSLRLKAALKYISSLTLGAYLLSWIFDKIYYPVLIEKIPSIVLRLKYMGIMVLVVSVSSLLLSAVVTFLSSQILKLIRMLISLFPAKKTGLQKNR